MENRLIVTEESKIRQIFREENERAQRNAERRIRYTSRKEYAVRNGLCLPTVDKGIKNGQIKSVRIGGRVLIIDE